MEESRRVTATVRVDFDAVVCMEGIDPFNDYLCELVGEDDLQDIQWTAMGFEESTVVLLVSGYVYVEGEDA